jgi:hypothetical protein
MSRFMIEEMMWSWWCKTLAWVYPLSLCLTFSTGSTAFPAREVEDRLSADWDWV